MDKNETIQNNLYFLIKIKNPSDGSEGFISLLCQGEINLRYLIILFRP